MTTRSLILHPYEVRAALAGTLGLVVRPVKPQPFSGEATYQNLNIHGQHLFYPTSEDDSVYDKDDGLRQCPLGVPGDRLRCKETWQEFFDDEIPPERTRAVRGRMGIPAQPDRLSYVAYRADGEIPPHPEHGKAIWNSPATMPAWASRITLEVVGVRCVRCADITYEDAEKAGVADTLLGTRGMSPLTVLRDNWTAKHGTRYPWETSWAWAVGVRRAEG